MPLGPGNEISIEFGDCRVCIYDSEIPGVSVYRFHFETNSDGKRAGNIFKVLLAPDRGEGVVPQVQGTLANIGKLGEVTSTVMAAMASTARESARTLVDEARRQVEELRSSAEHDFEQRRFHLAEEAKRLNELREELDRVQAEQRQREESLNKMSARLERRKEAKRLIGELTDQMAESLEASKPTKVQGALSWAVIFASLSISGALVGLGLHSALSPDPGNLAGLIVGGTLKFAGVVGLFSTLGYALKWQTGNHARAQRLEADRRRLAIDIGRANWLIEALMETSEVDDRAIPETLLDRLSKGLFDLESTQAHGIEADNVRSALSTILGEHATIKVSPTELTAEVKDRRRFRDKR
jgi:hypothetical protein